jgi:hypothetical protein
MAQERAIGPDVHSPSAIAALALDGLGRYLHRATWSEHPERGQPSWRRSRRLRLELVPNERLVTDHPRIAASAIPITRSHDHQLPNRPLVGQGAAYRRRSARPLGLRCGAGAPFSAGGRAALADELPHPERFLAVASACPPQARIVHGCPAASRPPPASQAMRASRQP